MTASPQGFPVHGLSAGRLLITAVCVCPAPGGLSLAQLPSSACHTGSSNLCKDHPVRWVRKFTSSALLPSCAVCRRSDSLSCPSLCTPELVGTWCPCTLYAVSQQPFQARLARSTCLAVLCPGRDVLVDPSLARPQGREKICLHVTQI